MRLKRIDEWCLLDTAMELVTWTVACSVFACMSLYVGRLVCCCVYFPTMFVVVVVALC